MKSRYLLIAVVALASCTPTTKKKPSSQSSSKEELTSDALSSTNVESTSSTELTSQTSSTKTSQTSNVVSTSLTSATFSTSKTSSTTSTKTSTNTSSTSSIDDDYFAGRTLLPCGYYNIDRPSNSPHEIKTSTSAEDWWNTDITDELPNNWTFIYGNSSSSGPTGHYANAPFYSYNESDSKQYPGGLKISKRSQGLQTPMFHHEGAKLEIRIGFSQINDANDSPDTSVPTGYLYPYSNDGTLIESKIVTIEKGSISKNTEYLRYYITGAQNIAYLEIRFAAQPYKSSQCYNVGIGYFNIHSWTYE